MKCQTCGGRIIPSTDASGQTDYVHVTGMGYVIRKSHAAIKAVKR